MLRRSTLRAVSIAAALASVLACMEPARAAADDAIATALREAVTSLDRSRCLVAAGSAVRASTLLSEFYRRRDYAPAWSDRAGVDELLAAIADAEQQGLDPADYNRDAIRLRQREGADDARAAAEFDLLLTDAFLRLARHVRHGKTQEPASGAAGIRNLHSDDPVADLLAAIDQGLVHELIDGLEPRTAFYQRLQRALAEYRRIEQAGGWPTIPAGPSLKPAASDSRVGLLRERLAATDDIARGTGGAADVYDETLVDGVRAFQARHGLETDGVLGRATLAALNVPVARRIDQIRATLERSRRFLRDLPDRFVMVNVAGFRVLYIEDGQAVWRSRVIVGQPYTETPMFRANIDAVILNPTWTIPASIVRSETLPKARRDPRYLSKMRISRVGGDYVQAAGEGNALGRIKLSMPNPHTVYLHDTPTRSLFDRTTRTFSHGCVRVENPVELAALVMNDPEWSVQALESAIATGRTRRIPLGTPVPVLVYYWSATMTPDGVVEFLPDIYGRDEAVIRGLRVPSTSGRCP